MTCGMTDRHRPDRQRAKVAIVGSGPGGAVTALLCAEAGHDTLLLEEGPDLPLDSCAHYSGEEILSKYRNKGLSASPSAIRRSAIWKDAASAVEARSIAACIIGPQHMFWSNGPGIFGWTT